MKDDGKGRLDMMNHTLGPWIARKMFSGNWDISAENGDGETLARTPKKADAHLIAAAPEMLEALKEALEVMGTWDDAEPGWATTARAAIAKAEGE